MAGFINLRNAKPLAANTPAAISIAGPLDDFARCLTSRKAVMYGAYWCPHCQNQKKLFGPSFGLVTYVECAAASGQAPACEEAGIKSYPTWVFDSGKQELGQLSLKELSDKTSCPL